MYKKAFVYLTTLLLGTFFFSVSANFSTSAQPPAGKKKKIKDFGSSLKRAKWNAEKNAAVEIKREKRNDAKSESEDVLRVETNLVVCDVIVLDKQKLPVAGLSQNDFVVTEDGQTQAVESFALGDNAMIPRSIVLIIDYSGSQLPYIKTSVEAAKILVDKLGPLDTMAIVTDDVELLADFTNDKNKLKKKLQSLEEKAVSGGGGGGLFSGSLFSRRFGRSAQYSALMATLNEAFGDEDRRPIVIFQTDGDEASFLRNPIITPSLPPNLPGNLREEFQKALPRHQQFIRDNIREFSLDDVYKTAEKSRATIYTVIPGFRFIGLAPDEQIKQVRVRNEKSLEAFNINPEMRARLIERFNRTPPEVLKHQAEQSEKVQSALAEVAEITGGWTDFLETPEQASDIYSRIFTDINKRYILGYYPTNNERDGKRRMIKVEVRGHPEYAVLGRKSYLAPGDEN